MIVLRCFSECYLNIPAWFISTTAINRIFKQPLELGVVKQDWLKTVTKYLKKTALYDIFYYLLIILQSRVLHFLLSGGLFVTKLEIFLISCCLVCFRPKKTSFHYLKLKTSLSHRRKGFVIAHMISLNF